MTEIHKDRTILTKAIPNKYKKQRPRIVCSLCRKGQCKQHVKERCTICNAWEYSGHQHDAYIPVDVIRALMTKYDPYWKIEIVTNEEGKVVPYKLPWRPNGTTFACDTIITFDNQTYKITGLADLFDNQESATTLLKRLKASAIKELASTILGIDTASTINMEELIPTTLPKPVNSSQPTQPTQPNKPTGTLQNIVTLKPEPTDSLLQHIRRQ